MTLETLHLYCDVIRLGSFSVGAAAHHVSQSAASQAVRQLEEDVGAQLIDRSKRPFTVTPEGRSFFEACTALLENFEKAKTEITSRKALVSGTVRVAVIYSIGLQGMSWYTQQFHSRYPETKVRLAYLHPHEVVDAVIDDTADLGILSFPTAHRSLTVIPWNEEPMVFVCHPEHRLARRRILDADDLKGEDFVAFDPDLAIRKAIDRALRLRGVRVKVSMEFDNIEAIKQAIALPAGVSILPRPSIARELEMGLLAAVRLDMPELVRPVGLIHRRQKTPTAVSSAFLDFLLENRPGKDRRPGDRSSDKRYP